MLIQNAKPFGVSDVTRKEYRQRHDETNICCFLHMKVIEMISNLYFVESTAQGVYFSSKLPAIGQRPLFPTPDNSRWGVTFSLAVELGRLPSSYRHVFWLQYQHRFGCRKTEEDLRVLWHYVAPECRF